MIRIIFCLVTTSIFLVSPLYAQASWEKIKTPVDVDLYKVAYLDSLHLWVAGDSGTVLFSSDQGMSWQIQNSGMEHDIQDIFFLNESLGWALTWVFDDINFQSLILTTTNGGINWERQRYRNINIILRTIFFSDSVNGWLGGDPFEFSFSNDGGLEWLPVNFDTAAHAKFPVNQIKFSTRQYGFAVGGTIDFAGVVWFTNDSGTTWKGYIVAPDIFDKFIFLDSAITLSLSADIEGIYPIGILKFNLQQNFWNYTEINNYGRVTALAKRTSTEIWGTVGNKTNFIVSTDAGDTWTFVPSPDSFIVFSIAYADSLKGFAVGENGYVFKYVPKQPSSIIDDRSYQLEEFILYQNYPNPFNPSTIIKWQSSVDSWQTLKIYDVLGNEVASLVDGWMKAGNHLIKFDGSGLSTGIYFYKLLSDNLSETKAMILLK